MKFFNKKRNAISVKEAMDDFDDFLFGMDDQIDALDDLANTQGIYLDVTMNSLEKLESFFLKLADDADEEIRDSLMVPFARYVGEIVSASYGGKWTLPLDDPKNVYYNSPVITGHTAIPASNSRQSMPCERYGCAANQASLDK